MKCVDPGPWYLALLILTVIVGHAFYFLGLSHGKKAKNK